MKDKLEELIDIFGNNRKNLVTTGIIYIVVMLIVIAIIWWPKSDDYATYNSINIDDIKTKQAQTYINGLLNKFKYAKKDEIKDLISSGYSEYLEKSKDQIISELENDGYFKDNIEIKGMNIYIDGDTYVYSTKIYSGSKSRAINIIETYPYQYEIVFDDFYRYDEIYKQTTVEKVKFTITSEYRNLKYVEYKFKIENTNDVYARFDFNSVTGVQAVLEDGTRYPLSNLVSGETYTNIESNMVMNKTLVFEIPAQLQEGIEYIVFNDVSIKFVTTDIKIEV